MCLICISEMTNNVGHFFNVLIGPLYTFFGENLFKPFAHFKIGLSVFSLLGYKSSSYRFVDHYHIDDLQIFYSILWIIFLISGGYAPGSTKVFTFDEVQFIYFLFCCFCVCCHSYETTAHQKSQRWMVCFLLGVS